LFSVFDSGAVKRSTDNVVSDAGKVFYAASADEHDAVFLKVVPLSADIGDHLLAV
jgi:hypothetical protein